ncbi:MAG: glycosyltransferase [Chitinivibrionales bacterium]|nr:glycosyltransferase [Chitinivibrionales bacterium]MBD3394046.1 glycosyltransferase [Chitinivibrionales bacterium]
MICCTRPKGSWCWPAMTNPLPKRKSSTCSGSSERRRHCRFTSRCAVYIAGCSAQRTRYHPAGRNARGCSAPAGRNAMHSMRASVVIPTLNRGAELCAALDDILTQDYPDFEVIVVDQTTTHPPDIASRLESYTKHIRYFQFHPPGVVTACNEGVRRATGDIVILVDDDVRVRSPRFIDAHARNYADAGVGGIAGQIMHDRQTTPRRPDPRYGRRLLPWMFLRLDTAHRHDIETGGAGNLSFRRTIWEELGGFDEHFAGNAYRWESDFCFRLRARGYRLVFDPTASLEHLYAAVRGGGCENHRLFETGPAAHAYLRMFFQNNLYFCLKNCPRPSVPLFLLRHYRESVCNRGFLARGPKELLGRHRAFLSGVADGIAVWRSRPGDAVGGGPRSAGTART